MTASIQVFLLLRKAMLQHLRVGHLFWGLWQWTALHSERMAAVAGTADNAISPGAHGRLLQFMLVFKQFYVDFRGFSQSTLQEDQERS